MIKCISFFLFIFSQNFICCAQLINNAASHQEQSNIIISYNLETKSPYKISLYVSINGGNTWDGPLKMVKGDVGDKISSGENRIIWAVLEEYKEFRGDNIKFQVRVQGGEEIKTKHIGTQDWTISNLDVSTYRNGDTIPEVQDEEEWSKLTTGAWCYYENKSKNGVKYGKLYNWYAVIDPRGLAPVGYHIPSDAEWTILINHLGVDPGKQMKSTNDWNNGGNGTNLSGFSGVPGGSRNADGTFNNIGFIGYWWGSNFQDATESWFCYLHYINSIADTYHENRSNGFSVRCLIDK